MTPHTNILADTTGAAVTGTSTGAWYAFPSDNRTHNVVAFNVVSGTGNVVLEGRNDPNSPTTTITTVTASDSQLVVRFKQMRVSINSGAALVVKVTVDRPGRLV